MPGGYGLAWWVIVPLENKPGAIHGAGWPIEKGYMMHKPFEPLPLRATKWIGTIAGIAGAGLIALNVGFVGYGFVLFLISSVLWTAAAAAQRDSALLVLQGVFAIIDIVGVVRWMA